MMEDWDLPKIREILVLRHHLQLQPLPDQEKPKVINKRS